GDERVAIAESVLDIARRLRDAAQARVETGAAPRLELLQAELGVTRAETDLDLSRSVRAAAQATLNLALNLPPQQPVAVAPSLAAARRARRPAPRSRKRRVRHRRPDRGAAAAGRRLPAAARADRHRSGIARPGKLPRRPHLAARRPRRAAQPEGSEA